MEFKNAYIEKHATDTGASFYDYAGSDYISRQEAIDEVSRLIPYRFYTNGTFRLFCMKKSVIDCLRFLPPGDVLERSGYPESVEKIRGKNQNWIPVKGGLPGENVPVNITWVNRKPEPYYENIKDIPFTATGIYFKGKWHWWSSIAEDYLAEYGRYELEEIDENVEVLAWMPLPEPYNPDF